MKATVYQLEKLRCHLCGHTIVAPPPEGVGEQKYDESARGMIALLRYGLGLPLNRQRRLQAIFGNPLPVSTQWDLLSELADFCAPAYTTLEDRAAQGELYFTDDTGVKILSLMNRDSKPKALEKDDLDSDRAGIFTTRIVVDWQRYRIVLFNSDRRHAGETLLDLLRKRQAGLDHPLHMCDALSRNMPAELGTIIANCLAHARRKFVEVRDYYENECRHVVDTLSVIYQNDATTRDHNMTADERLHYHQIHSGPAMSQLHAWLTAQLADCNTEPNSSLGNAIKYMLRHWERMTLFLRCAGAPLDNNVCERELKRAIIHRKNSLF